MSPISACVNCALILCAAGDAARPHDAAILFQLELDHVALSWSTAGEPIVSLDVSVEVDGSNTVFVEPGATVSYEVIGLLSNDNHEGLALIGFDLSFDGGALPQADEPTGVPTPGCENPMINFARPWGLTNPAGFGGTPIGGELVQVGGAQNTVKNTPDNADFPIGPVLTGVAASGRCGAAVLVTGSFTAPLDEGLYNLVLVNLFGNVIMLGEDGSGAFWHTEAFAPGSIHHLTIAVTEFGACCTPSGGCYETNRIDCEQESATFRGLGLTCDGDGDGDGVVDACDLCPVWRARRPVGPTGCVQVAKIRRPQAVR